MIPKKSLLLLGLLFARPLQGAARMISYGYMNCASCHENVLGKGILTPYGNSVDSAQSFNRAAFKPATGQLAMLLRGPAQAINQDLRVKMQNENLPGDISRRKGSLSHRSLSRLGSRFRLNTQVSVSQTSSLGPEGETIDKARTLVERLVLEHRSQKRDTNYEFSIGRDALPSGVNLGNESAFIKRLSNRAADRIPLQLRAIAWNDAYLASVYLYAPSSPSDPSNDEQGIGGLFEYSIPSQRMVLGLTSQVSKDVEHEVARESFGGYSRVGFNKYLGLMVELNRSIFQSDTRPYAQQTTQYWELHAHLQEWLVAQAAFESMDQDASHERHQERWKWSLTARLSRQATLAIDQQFEHAHSRWLLSLAAKT